MAFNPKDFYFKQAKKQQFVARSIYKLEEIDRKFRLIRRGDHILDLGAAPGSWSQYASRQVGGKGQVFGVDLKEIEITLPNAQFFKADMLEGMPFEVKRPFDLVMSDMAPKTTGIRPTDEARSIELCEMALSVGQKHLRPGGHFICKLFHGGDFETFRKNLRTHFKKVDLLRPNSTRKTSREIFFIGLHFLG